jgi:hypothetical protein
MRTHPMLEGLIQDRSVRVQGDTLLIVSPREQRTTSLSYFDKNYATYGITRWAGGKLFECTFRYGHEMSMPPRTDCVNHISADSYWTLQAISNALIAAARGDNGPPRIPFYDHSLEFVSLSSDEIVLRYGQFRDPIAFEREGVESILRKDDVYPLDPRLTMLCGIIWSAYDKRRQQLQLFK